MHLRGEQFVIFFYLLHFSRIMVSDDWLNNNKIILLITKSKKILSFVIGGSAAFRQDPSWVILHKKICHAMY